jgi:hypothetical protein
MSFERIAGLVVWFSLTAAVFGQQKGDSATGKQPPQTWTESTTLRSYAGEQAVGFRLVRTRTESRGREMVTEVFEPRGTEGKFETSSKTTTETVGIGSDSVKTRREAYATDAQGRLRLIETTDIDQQTFPAGTSRTIESTWMRDLNGGLRLSYRQVQEIMSAGPDVQQTETIFYLPGINQPLSETERVQQTERRFGPNLAQTDSHRDVRDANGQWQTTETRNREVQTIGLAEVREEETVRRLDGNRRLTLSERTVTRRSGDGGSEQVLIEVYSSNIPGVALGPGSALQLAQRVRITTTPTMNGGRQTISETEGRIAGIANGPDVWETQRRTFELDINGRLGLVFDETEQSEGGTRSTGRF